ncbi:MAG TPA: SRPBCC family protein [Thermoanaerobaculia bacterium]|nr:SRPBCC family protein [Thermoanaerobaculia bacterium]
MSIDPIRLSADLAVDPDAAFATFVDRFGDWWPPEYSWSGGSLESIGIEPRVGGFCFERGPYGLRLDWGRVTAWDPPRRLAFSWQMEMDRTPQPNPARASEVEVRFEPVAGGSRVTLVHDAFERHAVRPDAYREALAAPDGWPRILDRYAARVRRTSEAPWEGLTT